MIGLTFNFLLGWVSICLYWQILSHAIKCLLSVATGHGYVPFMPKHFMAYKANYERSDSGKIIPDPSAYRLRRFGNEEVDLYTSYDNFMEN